VKKEIIKMKLRVYSDGASKGNPGPSAIAFIIFSEDGRPLKKYSKCVGFKTNNQAEYEALISALEHASKITNQEVVCCMDSELVVKHLNGEYKVRNLNLKTLWLKVNDLKHKFRKTSFLHLPRMDNYIQEVDRLANQALDSIGGK